MKAMILAAGKGTRLLPLTRDIPKCLIPINGKPLIEHQISWLKKNGITNIAINLHYLPSKITSFLCDGSKLGVNISYSEEPVLMGTAGGVKKMEKFFDGDFLVYYGDVLTDIDLKELTDFHYAKNSYLTICVRKRPKENKRANIIEVDKNMKIMKFVEKPKDDNLNNLSKFSAKNYENCGIYFCSSNITKDIPKDSFSDFARDIFPGIVKLGRMYAFEIPKRNYWYEMGKPEKYEKNKEEIRKLQIKL